MRIARDRAEQDDDGFIVWPRGRYSTGSALFPTIRDFEGRGRLSTLPDGRPVMLDDNTSPTHAFLWAAGLARGLDVQFDHIAHSGDAATAS